jgi:DNA mismatch endonuclease (patch repair protein)
MTDKLSKKHRSWNMSRIRSKNTSPEMRVRSVLHKQGYRFRLHQDNLPGNPDLVLKKFRLAIFVHGCFWHRHKGCKFAYLPKTNTEFWDDKFNKNIERDQRVEDKLHDLGWKTLTIWECETKNAEIIIDKVKKNSNENNY